MADEDLLLREAVAIPAASAASTSVTVGGRTALTAPPPGAGAVVGDEGDTLPSVAEIPPGTLKVRKTNNAKLTG